MEVTPTRPTPELNHLIASALQGARFKERRQREADSDIRNDVVFFSPVIRIDAETQNVVIQYRDTQTGEVTDQFPNPEKATAYQHAMETTTRDGAEATAIAVVSAPTSGDAGTHTEESAPFDERA